MRAIRRLTVRTVLPAPLSTLGELAGNLRWVWHAETRALFESVDPDTWRRVANDPSRLLGEVSRARLEQLAKDRSFLRRLRDAGDDLQDYLEGDRWYQQFATDGPATIAYFSPEFGLTAVLPQYSGGLGILAGDHLKAASDLGVPIIGIGLLYRHGYFRQLLSRDGWQQERYPVVDPDGLPLALLREEDGTSARVQLALPGSRVMHAQIWVATVGRVPLLLLDTDVEENAPSEREVTDRLYGGGGDHRLLQEMLLGIGGVRALRVYCRITGASKPDVYHTNEGHAGFQGVERIRELGESDGLSFEAALEAVRAGTVFTTHTPVPAGIDRFARDLVAQHFDADSVCPGVPVDEVIALGAETYEGGDPAMFNMAVMGLRLGQRANGVSVLHGVVSRGMFGKLWPGFDETEVPISSITNGVHAPTWVAPEMLDLLERAIGPASMLSGDGWDKVDEISDDALWRVRSTLRERLVEDARNRLRESCLQRGSTEAELGWVEKVLDPEVLTIGFARRVPSYKRLTLMLRHPDRLKALLLDPEKPVQIVIAGKAHPADEGGKALIQQIVKFADEHEVRHRIVFMPGYEIDMAQVLVPGCDVWLNNPLRPYEACGTSGMKSALNGGLNLSIRDGWWDEWFDGRNGWAIPSAEGTEDDVRDDIEANALYELIEAEVAPRFYSGVDGRPPTGWLDMVRHTVKTLGPKVLATRMVRDYVQGLYTPAAHSYATLDSDFTGARELAEWKHNVVEQWPGVRVEHVESPGIDATEVGSRLEVRAFVTLAGLQPTDVDVQVVSGRVDDEDQLRDPTTTSLVSAEHSESGDYRYEGEVLLDRTGPLGYTVRIVPQHENLASVAELGLAAVPAAVDVP